MAKVDDQLTYIILHAQVSWSINWQENIHLKELQVQAGLDQLVRVYRQYSAIDAVSRNVMYQHQ